VRVLVLGGSGFVGGAAVRRMRARGAEVFTFQRSEGADVRGDRADLARHRDAFARLAPDVVVDAIAYAEADAAGLVAAVRGVARRTVVLSSQDVYVPYGRLLGIDAGAADRAPSREDSPLRASRFPYRGQASGSDDLAWSYEKILVEEAASSDPALPATILRLPCVYGAGDRHHRVGQVLARLETGAPFLLDAAKARWRWTRGAVENVAEAIALAATDDRASGRVYNVGEESALSESEWVLRIARASGARVDVREAGHDELPGELREPYDFSHDLVADTRRIRGELGYREAVEPESAVALAVDWERRERRESPVS